MASVHMYSPRKTSHTSSVAFIVISFFTDGPISVMVLCQPLSRYHTFVFLRHLAVYRLSFSPWCHLSFPCPHHFFSFKSDLKTATYMTTMRFDGRKLAHGGNDTSETGLGPYGQQDTCIPPLSKLKQWGAKHLPSWEWWGGSQCH